MIQFYAPDILENPILPESDSQHCIRVLRMREGDTVEVVDGKGSRYICRIADAHPKRAMLQVLDKSVCPLPWQHGITIAVAPTKHIDRMEWLLEKLVEVGINRFVPLLCRHSERKEIKVERLEKIAVSAMKQSLKAVMPIISPMTPITDLIHNDTSKQRYICYCADSVERRLLARLYRPNEDVLIMIGPEGDFSEDEVRLSIDNGFVPVSLGDNRLRTETAALYACSACHVIDEINQ